MARTPPFAETAVLRNVRMPTRENSPTRKIPGPEISIAPSVRANNQRSDPPRHRAMRLPPRPGTPRASSQRQCFHLFMAVFILSLTPPTREKRAISDLAFQFSRAVSGCLQSEPPDAEGNLGRRHRLAQSYRRPARYNNYHRIPLPSWRDFPMLMTHFGSGFCSHSRRGPILIDTVPETIIRSAWRGLERNTS